MHDGHMHDGVSAEGHMHDVTTVMHVTCMTRILCYCVVYLIVDVDRGYGKFMHLC